MTTEQKQSVLENAEVRVFHYRPQLGGKTDLTYTRFEFKRRGRQPAPTGGKTRVILTLADGREFWGEARCSDRDNYCRKTGREIALGRALKEALAS